MCAKLIKLELGYMILTEKLKIRIKSLSEVIVRHKNVVKYYDADYTTPDQRTKGLFILQELM